MSKPPDVEPAMIDSVSAWAAARSIPIDTAP
jgi:hypothetical protein